MARLQVQSARRRQVSVSMVEAGGTGGGKGGGVPEIPSEQKQPRRVALRRTLPTDRGCVWRSIEEGGKGGSGSRRGEKREEDGEEEGLGVMMKKEKERGIFNLCFPIPMGAFVHRVQKGGGR